MGCASSKRVDSAVADDVYRLPPTSIALFDISKIDEPWLITTTTPTVEDPELDKKPSSVPLPILDTLDTYELAPKSWSEVSKALEDLKPSLHSTKPAPQLPPPPSTTTDAKKPSPPHQKTHSIHILEELDAKPRPPPPELTGFRPVKENSFILRDRQERETKKEPPRWRRRDPLEGYPERRPPGNPDGVVLYITTLRGVRRTFEDCERARRALDVHAVEAGVAVDERDVSLHGEYLKELRELVGEGVAVPRLFVRGRYVGGVEEVVELGDSGKMREMMRSVAVKVGRDGVKEGRGCEGCGGARFLPCFECSGSCKVVGEDGKGTVRCGECNENGLVLCPLCH